MKLTDTKTTNTEETTEMTRMEFLALYGVILSVTGVIGSVWLYRVLPAFIEHHAALNSMTNP